MPIAQRVATVGDGTEGGPLPVISVINDATMEPGLQQVSLVEVVHEDPPAERTQLLAIEGVPKTPTRHTSPLREDISPLFESSPARSTRSRTASERQTPTRGGTEGSGNYNGRVHHL